MKEYMVVNTVPVDGLALWQDIYGHKASHKKLRDRNFNQLVSGDAGDCNLKLTISNT